MVQSFTSADCTNDIWLIVDDATDQWWNIQCDGMRCRHEIVQGTPYKLAPEMLGDSERLLDWNDRNEPSLIELERAVAPYILHPRKQHFEACVTVILPNGFRAVLTWENSD